MRLAELLEVRGHVAFVMRDENGDVKVEWEVENVLTANGKNGIADQVLASPTLAKPGWMALGTGSPGANALGTELDRNALTGKTRSTNVITYSCSWAAGDGTGALTEAGIFDAASVGNMWHSTTFAVKNKGATDTLNATWTLTIA